jgi:hypothetical protein
VRHRRLFLIGLVLLCAPCTWAGSGLELQSLSPGSVTSILGQSVFDASGDEVGRLVDVLVDRTGQPRAGVIDVGGFLGVGTRRVAVGWSLLHFINENGEIRIVEDLTQDEAAAAPEYRAPDGAVIVAGRRAARP